MQHTNASKTVRLPSLVDTLSGGFNAVHRCLWVLLIPLALDLLYWLGPRLSLQSLWTQLISLLRSIDPQSVATIEAQFGTEVPAVPLDLSFLGLPKFINLLTPLITLPQPPNVPVTWHIGDIGALLGAFVLINLGGLVATWVYLLPLSRVVRGTDGGQSGPQRWSKSFVKLLCVALMLAGIALAITIPLAVIASLVSLLSPVISQMLILLIWVLLLWLAFTSSYSFDAIMVSDAGPVRALLSSLFIVQRSFWGALGLLVLSFVIIRGLNIVWQQIAISDIGLLIAMLGSAYITSGLAAAHLVFYRDRLSRVAQRG
jgi:hypothetical protein